MKIAITGGRGQLGAELCRQLGDRAVGLDRDQLDITSRQQVRERLVRLRPDVVINTAAYTLVDKAEQELDACTLVNETAVGYLAEASNEIGARLIQISSDYVFGGDAERRSPLKETDPPAPQGAYARSKLAGEAAAARAERFCVARTCGLYGKREPGHKAGNFVDTMLRLGKERDCLRVVSDQHCTPSYVPHVARAIAFLAQNAGQGVYHVVNAGATTWFDFAQEIFRQAGYATRVEPITTAQYNAPAPRPPYSLLDTGKYRALGGPPLPPWQQALAEYLASLSQA